MDELPSAVLHAHGVSTFVSVHVAYNNPVCATDSHLLLLQLRQRLRHGLAITCWHGAAAATREHELQVAYGTGRFRATGVGY